MDKVYAFSDLKTAIGRRYPGKLRVNVYENNTNGIFWTSRSDADASKSLVPCLYRVNVSIHNNGTSKA